MRVAKGRDWVRRLVPALALASLAVAISIQVALADTAGVTVNPTSGLPTAAFTVDGTYTWTNGCPTLAPVPLTFGFFFDNNPNAPIWNVTTSACVKNLTDTGQSKPYTPPAALATVGSHTVAVNVYDATGKLINSARAVYTITAPPPPPTTPPPTTPPPTTPPPTTPPPTTPPPTTPPPTTPPPTTPPPTTPPPTTPPPTTPPPTTPPPTHRPSPIPTPVQHVAPSPTPTAGCATGTVSAACPAPSPTPCKQAAAVAPPTSPGGPGGGLALVLALFGGLPIVGVFLNSRALMSRRELAKLVCLMAVAVVLVASTSCGRPIARLGTAATPTPTVSVLPSPTC